MGAFDERLGLGSGEPWASGEEIDYLIRAVRSGARIRYDPSLTVRHDERGQDTALSGRRQHRIPAAQASLPARGCGARMLVRPAGGVLVSLAHRDRERRSLPVRQPPRPAARLPGDELREQRRVTVEPGLEREPLDRPGPRSRGVSREIGENEIDRVRERFGRGWLVALPRLGMRNADCRPRRRRARPSRRSPDKRPEAPSPSPPARASGTGPRPSCAGADARGGRWRVRRAARTRRRGRTGHGDRAHRSSGSRPATRDARSRAACVRMALTQARRACCNASSRR